MVKLKISDIMIRGDEGKGMVKLDMRSMEKLSVNPGDIIEIKGDKRTGALVMYTYPYAAGMGLACIDKFTRKNAGISIDDTVLVRKLNPKKAKLAVFAFRSKDFVANLSPTTLKQAMYLRPVSEGEIVKTTCRGSEPFTDLIMGYAGSTVLLDVVKTKPKGIVQITEDTIISIDKDYVKPKVKLDVPTEIIIDSIKYTKGKVVDPSDYRGRKNVFLYKVNGKYYVFKIGGKHRRSKKDNKNIKQIHKTRDGNNIQNQKRKDEV